MSKNNAEIIHLAFGSAKGKQIRNVCGATQEIGEHIFFSCWEYE